MANTNHCSCIKLTYLQQLINYVCFRAYRRFIINWLKGDKDQINYIYIFLLCIRYFYTT
jgi:hypothetical protein